MSDEEKKENRHKPRPISRREFAIGSVAALGATLAGAEPPPALSAEAQAIKLKISDDVKDILDERHIVEIDIKRVINYAETKGTKLYQPGNGRILAKLHIKDGYFYVEYEKVESEYKIYTAYHHRFFLQGESEDYSG